MKKLNNKAFTLVELIVVITILAVLATVAFISFQWYTTQSRDTVRLTDMRSIIQALNLQMTQNKDLPEWENMVNVTASGTTIFYQWTLSQNQLSTVWVFNGWFDPLTWSWVVYARNTQKNKFQIWVFLEQQQTTWKMNQSQIYADNSDKYFQTRWDKIWILLEKDSQNPISTDIDLVTTTQELQSYISNDKIIEGTWSTLTRALPNANCSRLYENGTVKNWIYEIYSSSQTSAKREVYCDFSYPEDIITDELAQTWDLINWSNVTQNTSHNTYESNIISMKSPIDSWYVIHQQWWIGTNYPIYLNTTGTCQTGKDITMRAWISYNNTDNLFRQEFRYPDGSRWFLYNTGRPHPEVLETKIVDGRTWRLEQVKWLIDRDFTGFLWYLGYNSWTPDKDHFVTGIRLWCE